jgi:hypothetical protein
VGGVRHNCKVTLSHYAVCNNTQRIELCVQLGTALNYQRPRNVIQFILAVVMEEVYFLFYFNMTYLLTAIRLKPSRSSTAHIYTQAMHRSTQWNAIHKTYITMKVHEQNQKNLILT